MGLFDSITGTSGGSPQLGQNDVLSSTLMKHELADRQDSSSLDPINEYAHGRISLSELMDTPAFKDSPYRQAELVANPFSGTKVATEQVQNNPLLSQLFGQNGQLNQAAAADTDLMNRGYSLQPEDYEAYGQASNQLARQFGQSEQGLAETLAQRGMSNSGAAASQFSGLYGNKNEQLGQLQQQIAQQRMQTNLQRLTAMQNYTAQLGGQAENALNDQYGRNQTDFNQRMQQESAQAGIENAIANTGIKGAQASNEIANSNDNPGLFGAIQGGIMSGVSGGISNGIGGNINSGINSLFSGGGSSTPTGGGSGQYAIQPPGVR